MKKIISLLLIAMMCLSFVVCGNRIYLIDSSLTKTAPQAWKTPVGRHILSKIKGFFSFCEKSLVSFFGIIRICV